MRSMNSLINKITINVLLFLRNFLVFPNQITFSGAGSSLQLCNHISRLGYQKILLVTDKILIDLGLANDLIASIKNSGGDVVIYDGVLPDPTETMVADGLALVKSHGCDAVLALGGGSSIDTAKAIAACATNGGIKNIVGILKVKQPLMPLFAIPTTSGTGSEVSIAAVISEPVTHKKGVIGDPKLIPSAVALDASLLTGVPASVTAATGLDALSHAVETYVGCWANQSVVHHSGAAVKLIFKALPMACKRGDDLDAREAMSIASYYAGLSLNDGSVGNVHALAHQIGGKYGIPHGVAISAVMPHVLEFSFESVKKPLAELADLIGVTDDGDSQALKAQKFIDQLKALQQEVGLSPYIKAIKTDDIGEMALEAIKEARSYPVPYFMSKKTAESVYKKIQAA